MRKFIPIIFSYQNLNNTSIMGNGKRALVGDHGRKEWALSVGGNCWITLQSQSGWEREREKERLTHVHIIFYVK